MNCEALRKISYGLYVVTSGKGNNCNGQVCNTVVGKVVDVDVLTDEEPITYAYYHVIKRGVTPEAAPTHIKSQIKEG